MNYFLIALQALLIQCVTVAQGTVNNQADYATLCTVYNVANSIYRYEEPSAGRNISGELLDEIEFLAKTIGWDSRPKRDTDSSPGPAELVSTTKENGVNQLNVPRSLGGLERVRGLVKPSRGTSPAMSAYLNRAVSEAMGYFGEVTGKAEEASKAFQTARDKAANAIFGVGAAGEKRGPEPDKKTFIGTTGSDWGNNGGVDTGTSKGCGNNGDKAAGISIISDLTCLCLGRGNSDASHAQKACGDSVDGGSSTDYGTLTNLYSSSPGVGWSVIKTECESRAEAAGATPTAERIQSALEMYRHRIGAGGVTFRVGGGTAAACDGGANANQVCINYKKAMGVTRGAETPKFTEIPWVKEMYAAADQIRHREDALRDRAAGVQALKRLNQTMWAALILQDTTNEMSVYNPSANVTPATVQPKREVSTTPTSTEGADDKLKPFVQILIIGASVF